MNRSHVALALTGVLALAVLGLVVGGIIASLKGEPPSAADATIITAVVASIVGAVAVYMGGSKADLPPPPDTSALDVAEPVAAVTEDAEPVAAEDADLDDDELDDTPTQAELAAVKDEGE